MVRSIVVACITLSMGACAQQHAAALPAGQARVVRVIDGDTIVVHLATGDESIRLIGVDTPDPEKTPLAR